MQEIHHLLDITPKFGVKTTKNYKSLAMRNFYQVMLGLFILCISEAQGYTVLAHWALNGTENGITLHGGPTFVEGRYPGSKAINFDKPSNCFARIPKVELRGRSFTIALWVKFMALPPVNETRSIFGDWSKTFNFILRLQTSQLSYERQKANASKWPVFKLTTNISHKKNKWFHIGVTWDQGMGLGKLYVDAEEVSNGSFDTNTTWFPPNEKFEIGADTSHPSNSQFMGSVMDLYIMDGALSRNQIIHLKGFIKFDELPTNKIVYVNETVTCRALGSPTPYVAWVRSGVVLVNKTSTAEITITDKGAEYKCVANNREGAIKTALFQVYEDDQNLSFTKWYRIQSPAGNQLPTTCVPQNRCGTQAPGWLNGPHPSVQDGIVKRTVCFHFNGDCCYQNTTVHIRKCFGFYVYKFSQISTHFSFRYCTDDKPIHRDIPDSIFKDIAGVRLYGHVIYKDSITANHYDCMSLCLLQKNCMSYNYSKEQQICELNDATHRGFSNSREKNPAFVYYEKLTVTAMKLD